MSSAQLCFDFDAPAALAPVGACIVDESRYWQPGMVTSLPVMAEIAGLGRRYTQMLPGVIELIDGDLAAVRIYAAPEWGYTLENYPLHLQLAVAVPLVDLGKYHHNRYLQQIVDADMLATGDVDVANEVRARTKAFASVHGKETEGAA